MLIFVHVYFDFRGMKKILITGASGFIGSFYVDEALKKGWEVWAGVRWSSNRQYLTDNTIHFIDLKYEHAEALQLQLEEHCAQYGKWDYVIHNAGLTKSADDASFFRVNHDYTINLINAFRKSGNTPEKFVYMSSLGAFGPGDEIHYAPLRTEDSPNPNTAYGLSKIQSERYIQSLPDFPYIILRPTGVYGPREKDYFLMVRMINRGLDVAVGFKPQLLNFIYVKDLVKVCFSAIESPIRNRIWFVADGDVYSSQEYTGIVKGILKKKYVLRITFPLFVVKAVSTIAGAFCWLTGKASLLNPDKYQIIKQRNWTCDSSALQKDLGFVPSYSLQKGMEETVEWYYKNGWL